MHVALVTDGIWPYVLGGMQKHSFYVCKYLAKAGIYVDVYHFNQSDLDIEALEIFSIEEKKFIRSIIVPFPKGRKFPGHYLYQSFLHADLVFKAMQPNLKFYDFIYTKGFTGRRLILEKLKNPKSFPTIGINFHGYEMFQIPPNFKIWWQQILLLRQPTKLLSKHADVVFSYGGKITEIIKGIGVKEEKIAVLPSGVESEYIRPHSFATSPTIKFLYLGRYERRKGIEEYDAAIQKILLGQVNSIEFHFVGPIPEATKINHPKVIYHGEIRDRSLLMQHIQQCDILVCPSWSEGMPNVILEAMSNGLAVIATDVGAVSGLVNKQTGWLIPKANTELIVETILSIMAQKETINVKKQAALDHIRQSYTWEILSHQLIQIIEQYSKPS